MSNRRQPYIFVTLQGPDDGGDFGPNTPGTKTSGIQEAIDYAHKNCRDVHIFGGRGGMHDGKGLPDNVYTLDETLRVPWSQDLKVDGGNYVLSYTKSTGHAIQIDSQMNCRYKFGLIGSQSCDAVVCIKPETPGPDDFVVITASIFDFSAIVSHHPDSTAMLIDSSKGLIINSKIVAEETNSMGTAVHVTDGAGTGHWISNNQIDVRYGNQYHARERCTGLRLGDPGSTKIVHNSFEMSYHAPKGVHLDQQTGRYVTAEDFVPEEAIGVDIFAQRNLLNLSFYGKRAPGHDIVFEPDARDNTVFAFNLPNGITNRAETPTNRIIANWPVGFDVSTPPVPASGESIMNTTPYTVQVIILTPGTVSNWTLTDAGSTQQTYPRSLSLADNLKRPQLSPPPPRPSSTQTISSGLFAGQTVTLEPGEKIQFTYSEAPTWRWKALR